ncbi:MAG: hypothetical protein ACD_79C01124G0004, partial [uncultured bacterium]
MEKHIKCIKICFIVINMFYCSYCYCIAPKTNMNHLQNLKIDFENVSPENIQYLFNQYSPIFGGKGFWLKILEKYCDEFEYIVPEAKSLTVTEFWSDFVQKNLTDLDEGNKLAKAYSENRDSRIYDQINILIKQLIFPELPKEFLKEQWRDIIIRSSGSYEDGFEENLSGVLTSIRIENNRNTISACQRIFAHALRKIWLGQYSENTNGVAGLPKIIDKKNGIALIFQEFHNFHASGVAMTDLSGHISISTVFGDADKVVNSKYANNGTFLIDKLTGSIEYDVGFDDSPYEFSLEGQYFSKITHTKGQMIEFLKSKNINLNYIDGKLSPLSIDQVRKLKIALDGLESKLGIALDVEFGFIGEQLYIHQIRPIIRQFDTKRIVPSKDLKQKIPFVTTNVAIGHTPITKNAKYSSNGITAPLVIFSDDIDTETIKNFENIEMKGKPYIRVQFNIAEVVKNEGETTAKVLVDPVLFSREAHSVNFLYPEINAGKFCYANGQHLRKELLSGLVTHPECKGIWISKKQITYFSNGLKGAFYGTDMQSSILDNVYSRKESKNRTEFLNKLLEKIYGIWDFEYSTEKQKNDKNKLAKIYVIFWDDNELIRENMRNQIDETNFLQEEKGFNFYIPANIDELKEKLTHASCNVLIANNEFYTRCFINDAQSKLLKGATLLVLTSAYPYERKNEGLKNLINLPDRISFQKGIIPFLKGLNHEIFNKYKFVDLYFRRDFSKEFKSPLIGTMIDQLWKRKEINLDQIAKGEKKSPILSILNELLGERVLLLDIFKDMLDGDYTSAKAKIASSNLQDEIFFYIAFLAEVVSMPLFPKEWEKPWVGELESIIRFKEWISLADEEKKQKEQQDNLKVKPYYDILLFDDEEFIIEAYKALLENNQNMKDCRFFYANDYEEAVKIMKGNAINLIIMDCNIPPNNEYESTFIDSVSSGKPSVISISGWPKDVITSKIHPALRDKLEATIQKPIKIESIFNIIQEKLFAFKLKTAASDNDGYQEKIEYKPCIYILCNKKEIYDYQLLRNYVIGKYGYDLPVQILTNQEQISTLMNQGWLPIINIISGMMDEETIKALKKQISNANPFTKYIIIRDNDNAQNNVQIYSEFNFKTILEEIQKVFIKEDIFPAFIS